MKKMSSVKITISYGYDIHSLILLASDFEKIMNGKAMDIKGQRFSIEGQSVQDIWSFKNKLISVNCDNGFEVFQGSVDDIIQVEDV